MMTRLLAPRGAVIYGVTLGLIAAIPQEKMAGICRAAMTKPMTQMMTAAVARGRRTSMRWIGDRAG